MICLPEIACNQWCGQLIEFFWYCIENVSFMPWIDSNRFLIFILHDQRYVRRDTRRYYSCGYVARHNGDCMAFVMGTNHWMAFGRLSGALKTFTFRLDDVPCCVWESPDSGDVRWRQAKLPRLGWFVPWWGWRGTLILAHVKYHFTEHHAFWLR